MTRREWSFRHVYTTCCRYLSLVYSTVCDRKLLNFVTMRRLITKVINRVLLSEVFTPAMGLEAEMHTQGRRRLIVGLGNPGLEGTRHSVGFSVLGALAGRLGVEERWRGDKHVSGDVIMSQLQHTHIVLLRPKLLMNVNGVSVAKAAKKYGVQSEDILLIHDELDKPLGKIAIKHGGSARGHNGVRSCVDCLQTDVMVRLRVGIGRPSGRTSVERHVLSPFTAEENKVLDSVLVQSVDLLLSLICPQEESEEPRKPHKKSPKSDPKESLSSPAGGAHAAERQTHSPVQDSAAAQKT